MTLAALGWSLADFVSIFSNRASSLYETDFRNWLQMIRSLHYLSQLQIPLGVLDNPVERLFLLLTTLRLLISLLQFGLYIVPLEY